MSNASYLVKQLEEARAANDSVMRAINRLIKQELAQEEQRANRPTVVCLCGSTRFYDAFQQANYERTMAGEIVLSVGFYAGSPGEMVARHGEGVGITPEQKLMLDDLHKRKIDLCDYVLVLNVGGYIGQSTASEIAYAEAHGKPVRYLEPREQPKPAPKVYHHDNFPRDYDSGMGGGGGDGA